MTREDRSAEVLVTDHVDFARKLARAVARRMPMDPEDVESAAMLALVKAAQAFDPGVGLTFESYVAQRIRWAIQDEAREKDDLSRDQRQAVKAGKASAPQHVDYDDVAERVSGEAGDSVEDWMSAREMQTLLRHLPRKLQMVARRHLVDDITLLEIGDEMGVTESRACQIFREAKERLRVRLLPDIDERHQRPSGVGPHGQRFCPRGHELVGYNLALRGSRKNRVCRHCVVERTRQARWAQGTRPFASLRPGPHKLRKLADHQVREILGLLQAGERVTHVARRYGVAPLVVILIRDRKTYRNVAPPPGYTGKRRPHGKLTVAQAQEIARRMETGEHGRQLAREYGVSETCITDIRHGRHHRAVKRGPACGTDARHRPSPRAKLSADQVRQARAALTAGVSVAEIARSLGISWGSVRLLRDGRTYRYVAPQALEAQP